MARTNELAVSHRRLLVPAAAALLAAGLVACGAGNSEAGPRPTPAPTSTPTPTSAVAPARIPYLWGANVYVGNTAFPGPWNQEPLVHGSYAVAEMGGGEGLTPSTLVVLHGGVEVALLKRVVLGVQSALQSWDGAKLGYLEVHGAGTHLVVQDLETGHELGRLAVNRDLFTRDRVGVMLLDRLDNDGTLHWSNDVTGFAWKPGRTPVAEKGRHAWVPAPGFPSPAAFDTRISADGRWGAWLQAGPGAKEFARGGHAVTLRVQHPHDATSRIVIELPRVGNTFAHDLRWETPSTLLMDMESDTGRRQRLVRCSIVTRRCEDVPTPSLKG